MNRKRYGRNLGAAAILLPLVMTAAAGGCRKPVESEVVPPRPVTATTLAVIDPTEQFRITGSVEPWAEEDIGFDVSGRLEFVAKESVLLEGRWVERGVDEAGQPTERVLVQGELLARLDPDVYDAAVAAAEANLNVAIANLEGVVPAEIEGAVAERERAFERQERMAALLERKAISQEEYDQAAAEFKVSQAKETQANASLTAAAADVERARSRLRQAQIDRERTERSAPFSGAVSEVFVQAGGYVSPGKPVAHMVMMDPIRIQVRVSPESNRRLKLMDLVTIFLTGREEPLVGRVEKKSTVADETTRTFTVSIIVRNHKVMSADPPPAVLELPRVSELLPVVRFEFNDPAAPLFADEQLCIRQDAQGHFVMRAEGIGRFEDREPQPLEFTVKRVNVKLGEDRRNLQGIYLMRELADTGGLVFGDPLVVNPPEGLKDGDHVALLREDWLLQPGGLVEVSLGETRAKPGFYVPLPAIIPGEETGTGYVMTVVDGEGRPATRGKARRVEVTLGGTVGLQRLIEPKQPESLGAGSRLILEGATYVRDGDEVVVVQSGEEKL